MGIFAGDLECPFCLLFEDGYSPVWRYLFDGALSGDEIVLRTDSLSVILDTAPLREGHLLVVSNDHVPSLAGLPPEAVNELVRVKCEVETRVRKAYGPCTIFEHGAYSFARNAGSCVDHAHLHVLPGVYDLSAAVSVDYPETKTYDDYVEALDTLRGAPYLLFGNAPSLISGVAAPVCSTQYLRRTVARLAGAAHRWNWRDCVRLADTFGIRDELRRSRQLLAA